jgi:cell division protein FtsL
MAKDTETDRVVTINGLVKVYGIAAGIITTVISVVWFFASMSSDLSLLRNQVQYQEQRIAKTEARQDGTDKSLNDLSRKLDVAVSILERMDKQINKNP